MKHPAGKAKSVSSARNLAAAISQAVALHQRGELDEASRRYRSVLSAYPHEFDVLHCLGVLEIQRGRPEEACRLIGKALEVNPNSAEAHLNLGNALKTLNRLDAALTNYDRALVIRADYAEAYNNRGDLLLDLKRHEEALASYDSALAIAPSYPEALNSRGIALHHLQRYGEALADYDRVLTLAPDYVDALNNRGNVLHDLKRHAEALQSYHAALAIDPSFAEALNNRGNVLQDLKRYEEALLSYEKALAIVPSYAEALNNRGNALHKLKMHDDALASYDLALAIAPDYAQALDNRANACQTIDRHEEAIRDFERLLKLNSPEIEYLPGNLLHAKMQCCDWRAHNEESARVAAEVRAGIRCTTPFIFLGISHSPQDQMQCSKLWAKDKFPGSRCPVWKGERYSHDRIRVAYLSSDLRDHAVAQLMAELFERHDRTRFETTAVSYGADTPSEMRTRLIGAFERFIDVRQKSDREVARLLQELEIDIAVDLNGFTMDCRTGILALRPAPVQVSYLGYPGTLGADYIDYVMADRIVISPEHQPFYTEKVVYLPDSYLVNDATRRIAERTPSRAEAGLPEQGFVFCSFNKSYKITPAVFDIWMRLLRQVEGSVLWLSENNAAATRNLRREAAEKGVEPQRLVFAPRVEHNADHLARQRLADLFLDTLPYNAHTSASDALWAGLPVLTCVGATFAGRVAASLLNAIGVPELITHSSQAYEALALRLATEAGKLAGVKAKLARNREIYPLFDTDRFRRHIEAAYTTMWERSQRGEAPASFAVEPTQ